jgi:hypothetical protein
VHKVAKYALSEFSIEWLKENRFSDDEIDSLQNVLNRIDFQLKKGEARVKVPKDSTDRVKAMAFLLDSITDADGRPICFEDNGLIDIPDEARAYFDDDLEMEQLENVLGKLRKTKFARRYSYPRRRGMHKEGDKFGGI